MRRGAVASRERGRRGPGGREGLLAGPSGRRTARRGQQRHHDGRRRLHAQVLLRRVDGHLALVAARVLRRHLADLHHVVVALRVVLDGEPRVVGDDDLAVGEQDVAVRVTRVQLQPDRGAGDAQGQLALEMHGVALLHRRARLPPHSGQAAAAAAADRAFERRAHEETQDAHAAWTQRHGGRVVVPLVLLPSSLSSASSLPFLRLLSFPNFPYSAVAL